jgi:drug/metabolite transporter (DMT)-like permease
LIDLRFAPGDLLMIGAVVAWAVYSVLLKQRSLPVHHLSLLTALFVAGFVGTAPFFAWELAAGEPLRINLASLAAIAYGALFMSIGAYFCFNRGVAALGPNIANAYGYLAPLFAALFAVPFLGETLQPYHGASFALIVLGVYLATVKRGRSVAARPTGG